METKENITIWTQDVVSATEAIIEEVFIVYCARINSRALTLGAAWDRELTGERGRRRVILVYFLIALKTIKST